MNLNCSVDVQGLLDKTPGVNIKRLWYKDRQLLLNTSTRYRFLPENAQDSVVLRILNLMPDDQATYQCVTWAVNAQRKPISANFTAHYVLKVTNNLKGTFEPSKDKTLPELTPTLSEENASLAMTANESALLDNSNNRSLEQVGGEEETEDEDYSEEDESYEEDENLPANSTEFKLKFKRVSVYCKHTSWPLTW